MSEFDKAVGATIKRLRILEKITMQKLAENLGVSFQQVQKYESGVNRVSSEMLWKISNYFGVTTSLFFPGMLHDNLTNLSDEELILIAEYRNISCDKNRAKVLKIIKILGDG